MEKDFVFVILNGDGIYIVEYIIMVVNEGGVVGVYGFIDMFGFDDDVIINNGSFSG